MSTPITAFQNRREFFRLKFASPLEYKIFDKSLVYVMPKNSAYQAQSKDISQAGIMFSTEKNPPMVSSLVWLNLDFRTLKICREIESNAMIVNGGLVGRIVRVEETHNEAGDSSYDVGVCFVTQSPDNARIAEEILAKI